MEDKVKEKLITTLQLLTIEHLASKLDLIADRYEMLFDRSEKFFKDMKDQFIQDIIKIEVEREVEKNKKRDQYRSGKRYGTTGLTGVVK